MDVLLPCAAAPTPKMLLVVKAPPFWLLAPAPLPMIFTLVEPAVIPLVILPLIKKLPPLITAPLIVVVPFIVPAVIVPALTLDPLK